MKYKILLLSVTVILLTSCSFNTLYLQPTVIPADTQQMSIEYGTDNTIVNFSVDNYQPTFLKNGTDTIDYNFTIESVIFENSKGHKLNGWMLKPKNIIPTITLLHFHGNAGSVLSQYQRMSNFIKYGFQVFIFDYSGFGLSEGKATRKNVILDGNAALNYVKSRPDITNTKLVIYGQSLGGHLAAVIAAQREDDIDGVVIEGAFSSHRDIAATLAGGFGLVLVNEKYAGYKSIRSFHKPVLVIHSTEDFVIPFRMGVKIFDNANEPKEFYEIQKCHICGPQFYAETIAEKIKKMVIKEK